MPPPPPAPGAEVLTFDINDGNVDNNGEVTLQVDNISTDKNLPNDVTITNSTLNDAITLIAISKMGKGDGEQDVFRLDLTTFDDDFTVTMADVGPEDVLIFEGVHTYADNGDGTHTITYYGTDAALHTVTVVPGAAQIDIYYQPDGIVDGGDDDELMDGSYSDFQGDQLDGVADNTIFGNGGADTITSGSGADTIFGDYDLPGGTLEFQPLDPSETAEELIFSIDDAAIEDGSGIVTADIDQITADVGGEEDIVFVDSGTEAITQIDIAKIGNGDDQEDVFRFDLSTFDDDFIITIKSEGPEDRFIFTNVDTIVDNGDGTQTITYTGKDGFSHTILLTYGVAQVETYADDGIVDYADVIDAGAGDDVVDGGFGDDSILAGADNDTVIGNLGGDTLLGGTGDDLIYGDFDVRILDEEAPPPDPAAEPLSFAITDAVIPGDGKVTINTEDLTPNADTAAQDITITDESVALNFTEVEITRLGDDDGFADVIRFDLRGFDEDFTVVVANERADDTVIFVGVESAIENPDGTWSISYIGKDDLLHLVTAVPDQAQVEVYYAAPDEINFADFGDLLEGGDGGDTLDGGYGSDDISGGLGDDVFQASTASDTYDGGDGVDTYDLTGGLTLEDEFVDVTIDNFGDATVSKNADGSTDTLTSVETIIADEVAGQTDSITLTDAVRYKNVPTEILNFEDTAVGIFIPDDGSGPIAFGPGENYLLSDILNASEPASGEPAVPPIGTFNITSGDESAQVGDIAFSNFETINFSVICFASGTQITTRSGKIEIQHLRAGDLVWTLDHGYVPIKWIGSTTAEAIGDNAPIVFHPQALGNERTLCVSPQHRMLIFGRDVELLFGHFEVFVPAKFLVDGCAVSPRTGGKITYFHMLFEEHEIVEAEGALAESFHPGHVGFANLDAVAQEEIFAVLPDLRNCPSNYGTTARMVLKEYEGRLIRDALSASRASARIERRGTYG